MLNFQNLNIGEWYIPAFEEETGLNTNAPFYKYLGGNEFETEYGEIVMHFYHPGLGVNVAVDAPDCFIQ